jgi:hypothetical protein
MVHRFSNSGKVRQEVLAVATQPKFETWESVPLRTRLLILEHITLTLQEVLREV